MIECAATIVIVVFVLYCLKVLVAMAYYIYLSIWSYLWRRKWRK